jgi:hypothetical protein
LSPDHNGKLHQARVPDAETPADHQTQAVNAYSRRHDFLGHALNDAELLLSHVASRGLDIDDGIRRSVLRARALPPEQWTEQTGDDVLVALTKLAARVCPVTAESLKACAHASIKSYRNVTLVLALVILVFSVMSFVTSGISEPLRKDIATANDLAVKLTAQLGTPQAPVAARANLADNSDIVTELQQFAATIRAIDIRARQLNWFIWHMVRDPYEHIRDDKEKFHDTFELPPGLPDLAKIKEAKIEVMQHVRYFAQSVLDDVSVIFGAVAACILPVLYALLGTCAYLLRCFEQETKAKTFVPSRATSARFLIAAIGGAVVGLFNFTLTQGASISPLAIAFLAGYATDVFFSFLEALTKSSSATPPKPASAQT